MEIYNGTSTSVIDDSSKLSEVYSEYKVDEANGKRLYSFSKFNSLGTDNLWLRLHKNSKRTDWDDQAINYTADLPKFVKVVQSDTTGEGDSATTTTTYSYLHKDESSLFPNNKGINGINEYKRVDEEASEEATKKAGKPVTIYKDEVSLVSLSPCTFDIYESEDENAEKKTSVSFAEEVKPGYDKYIGAPYTIKIDFGKLDTVTAVTTPISFHTFSKTEFEQQNMLQFLNGQIYKFEEVYNEDTDTVTYKINDQQDPFKGETVEERCFLIGVSVYCINRDQKTLIWDSVSGDGSTEFSYTTTVNSDLTVNFGLEYDLLFVESPADGIVQYKTEVYYEGIRIDNPNRI